MKQLIIFSILLINIILTANSQPFELQEKIHRTQVYGLDTYSHLIQEDTYYKFYIKDIISVHNGYLFHLATYIDTLEVQCYAISPKIKIRKGEKIKKGHDYELCLKKYNTYPADVAVESVKATDFLFGNVLIPVNQAGTYKYMFFSPMLCGNRIKNYSIVEEEKSSFVKDSVDIAAFMDNFINLISKNYTQEQLYSIMDTNAVKKLMSKYSVYVQGRNPNDLINYNRHHSWSIYQTPRKNYSKKELRQKNTYQLFSEMLVEEYDLPIDKTSFSRPYITDIQCFFITEDFLYTLRVVWENLAVKKRYVVVCNIKKTDSGYILMGINKPYWEYGLSIKENNCRFVP